MSGGEHGSSFFFALVVVVAAGAGPAWAQCSAGAACSWAGTTGSWFDGANWTPAPGPPNAASQVFVTNGGTANIDNNALTATSSNATIDGSTVHLLSGNSWTNNGSAALGINSDSGALTVGSSLRLGLLQIDNGASVTTTGTGGPANVGTVIIGDAANSGGNITLGNGTAGTAQLLSTATGGSNLDVGYAGSGALNVNANSTVSGFNGMTIGALTGSSGFVTINGTNASVDVSGGSITVGSSGVGTLNVENGGTLTSGSGASIADQIGSTGSSATVTGTGSVWTANNMTVGNNAVGSLTVSSGGTLNVGGNGINIANSTGSATSNVLVDNGSINFTGSAFSTSLNVAPGDNGSMTVQNGGLVTDTVSGNVLTVGGGALAPSTGSLTVTGTGSSVNFGTTDDSGTAEFANNTNSTAISITGGGHLTTDFSLVGFAAVNNVNTNVLVSGTGSNWTSNDEIILGFDSDYSTLGQTQASTGSLTINLGATVDAQAVIVGRVIDTGGTPTSTDTLSVDGAGSRLDITAGANRTGGLTVGYYGTGVMSVTNGAQVTADHVILGLSSIDAAMWDLNAPAMNSTGTLTVSGTGSSLTVGTSLIVGDNLGGTNPVLIGTQIQGTGTATGFLDILAGATVSDATATLGANLGATGTVLVDGVGSNWLNTGTVTIGNAGSGLLTISNSANVSASSILLGQQGQVRLLGGSITGNVEGTAANTGNFVAGGNALVTGELGGTTTLSSVIVNDSGTLTVGGSLGATQTTIGSGTTGNATLIMSGAAINGPIDSFHAGLNTLIIGPTGGTTTLASASSNLGATTQLGMLELKPNATLDASLFHNTINAALVSLDTGSNLDIGATATYTNNTQLQLPGTGVRTLTGNLVQGSGGLLTVEVNPTSAAQLKVTGNAALNGTLGLVYDPGVYSAHTYTLLTASSVTGNFTNILTSGTPGAFDQTVTIDPADVLLTLSAHIVAPTETTTFSSTTSTIVENGQLATAMVLDRIGSQLGGIGTGPLFGAARPPTGMQLAALGDRDTNLAAMGEVAALLPQVAQQYGGWFRGIGNFASVDNKGALPGFNADSGGFMTGFDRPLSPTVFVGIAGSYVHSDVNDRSSGTGGIDNGRVMAYGGGLLGSAIWSATAGYAHDWIDTSRPILGIGTAQESHGGDEVTAGTQFGLPLPVGQALVTPKAGLEFLHLGESSFAETGAGGFDLTSPSRTTDSLRPFVALAAAQDFTTADGTRIVPEARLGFSYEALSNSRGLTVDTIGGVNFQVPGARPSRAQLTAGIGVTVQARSDMDVYVDYDSIVHTGNTLDQAASAGLRIKF